MMSQQEESEIEASDVENVALINKAKLDIQNKDQIPITKNVKDQYDIVLMQSISSISYCYLLDY